MRLCLAMLILLAAPPVGAADRIERWSATSSTAMGITGDISLSPTRLQAAGKIFPLAVAADVRAFGTEQGPRAARILRVTKPADPKLLRGNTLCGAPVRWIVAYQGAGGKELNLAVFSGVAQPRSERDDGLCGTFLYSR